MRSPLLILCLSFGLSLVSSLAGCRSTPPTPEHQYLRLLAELKEADGMGGLVPEGRQKLEEIMQRVEGWAADGALKTPQDQLWAAACLVQAESPERVELAQKLAVKAALGGESRAKSIMAQAMDKQALQEGRPQPYGTQYVFLPERGLWILHDIDPKTTDAEREEVGIPPLSELENLVNRMNQARQDRMLDWAEKNKPNAIRTPR